MEAIEFLPGALAALALAIRIGMHFTGHALPPDDTVD